MDINTDNRVVDIGLVQPNDYNPKLSFRENEENAKEFEKVKNSIKVAGQIQPLIVRELEDGKFEIINGYHRWEAMKELGFAQVEIKNLGKICFDVAVSRALLTEDTKIPIDSVELASLMKRLVTEEKPLGYWAEVLPYTAEAIQSKIDSVDFNFDEYGKELVDIEVDVETDTALEKKGKYYLSMKKGNLDYLVERHKRRLGNFALNGDEITELLEKYGQNKQ